MGQPAVSPEQFFTFGGLLKYLRRREELTQRELALQVGYSDTQISRMEQNQRVPDAATLMALFVPALHLEREAEWAARLWNSPGWRALASCLKARRRKTPSPKTTCRYP